MWRSLKKQEIELPYDPAIPLLGIHTKETRIERDMCTPMFITALFLIARTYKSHSEHLLALPPLAPHAHVTNHWNSVPYNDKYAFPRRPKIGNFSLCLVVNLVSAGLSHGFRLIWLLPSTGCHPLYPLLLLP